jgi:hypothetical protein
LSPAAAAIAAIARGLGPRGFSFEASLTIVAGSSPSSRAELVDRLPRNVRRQPRT